MTYVNKLFEIYLCIKNIFSECTSKILHTILYLNEFLFCSLFEFCTEILVPFKKPNEFYRN